MYKRQVGCVWGSAAIKRRELAEKLDGVQKHSDGLVSCANDIKRAVAVSEKEMECVQNSHLGDGDEDRAWRVRYTESGQDHQDMLYVIDHTMQKLKGIRNKFSGADIEKIAPKTDSYKKVIGDLDNITTSIRLCGNPIPNTPNTCLLYTSPSPRD